MNNPHCFDRHLGSANGNPDIEKRRLGNTLAEDTQKATTEWNQEMKRFLPTDADLEVLPDGSWLFKSAFTLSQPFTSKSEEEFHPYEERQDGKIKKWFEIQNPIVRDYLTRLPLVKPTTWKGHLKFAARMEVIDDKIVSRLFGTTRSDDNGLAGRLRFFPTFFNVAVQREVVTPLKRDTRTPARGPIDIETVPSDSKGTFCLLYIPNPRGMDWTLDQIAEDLEAVVKVLGAMFLRYGFSAKKTAGWGVIEDSVSEGYLAAKGLMWPQFEGGDKKPGAGTFQTPDDAYLALMEETGMPKAEVKKPDGAWLSNKEFNALADKPTTLSVYRQFRNWYNVHGATWQNRLAGGKVTSTTPVRTYPVESVTALCDFAKRLTEVMRRENANG